MLEGCVPWPEEAARAYRRLGLWEDITVAEMVERSMRAAPQKTALVFGDRRISYEELVRDSRRLAVALVGLPDPVFGERACACVILQPGATLDFEQLVAYLRQQKIASFKLPERLEIMDEFPVSPVGKILKRALRERLLG